MAKTIKEMIEVMVHYANGGDVESCVPGKTRWHTMDDPGWNWEQCSYRIKEEKIPSDGVPWEYIDSRWNYFAVDADGTQWLFMVCPEKGINGEIWTNPSGQCYIEVSCAFIVEESQPWTESLRKRPD